MKALARAVLVLMLGVWVGPVKAAPIDPASREEAQARFDRGREFFEDGDFSAALVEFRRAYELSPNYKLLYNVGQVCYQLQDYPCALQSFSKYLADGGSEVAASRVNEVQKELEKLRARVARVVVSTTVPGAEVAVDDVPVGKTPLGTAVVVSAGRRRISASLKGYLPVTKTIEVAGMELAKLTIELFPTGEQPVVARPPRGDPKPEESRDPVVTKAMPAVRRAPPSPWFWAIPAGLLAGGIPMGVWASRESSALVTNRASLDTTPAKLAAMSANTKTYALVADVLDGAAIVSAVVLGILTLFPPEEAPAQAAGVIGVGFGHNGLLVTGHF